MHNRVIGGVGIITGAMVGAGMLTMPIATAFLSFQTNVLLFILSALFTSCSALLFFELYQNQSLEYDIAALFKLYLGKVGALFFRFGIITILYTLSTLYLLGAYAVFDALLKQLVSNISISQPLFSGGLIAFIATMILLGLSRFDYINRIFLIGLLLSIGMATALLLPEISRVNLFTPPTTVFSLSKVSNVILILFGFMFFQVIPTVIRYVNGNLGAFKKALLWGAGIIPLSIYIIWEIALFGSLSPDSVNKIEPRLESLLSVLSQIVPSPYLVITINFCALLAIITSLFGVVLGLVNYFTAAFNVNSKNGTLLTKSKIMLLTFLPPLFATLFYPDAFIRTASLLVSLGSILAFCLPPLAVWRKRQQEQYTYHLWGGNAVLLLIFMIGGVIVLVEVSKFFI